MFDPVTDIGEVIDGYPVFWRWEIAPPNHDKGETHRGKSTWCFAVPATTEFDPT